MRERNRALAALSATAAVSLAVGLLSPLIGFMIGGLLVIIAMAIYYQLSGVVAITALVLNLVFQ